MIRGEYFDGRSATGIEATLEFGADGAVHVHGAVVPLSFPLAEVKISERIGNITRRITLPNGGVFETPDNDAVDEARDALGLQRGSSIVHWLESRWQIAVGSLVVVALVSIAFLHWGVPAVAKWAASVMPVEVDRAIGTGTLDVLDRVAFRPSKLPDERQAGLTKRFADMTKPLHDGHEYQLEFRRGGLIGANAFALPSGIIVMTDELVKLAKNDDELISVLAHEVGHVRGRHALRQMLQAAGVSALAVALLGDVSSISGVLSAAPALLHAKHSRDFEREADAFSKQWLREHGIAESNFDAILCRISGSHGVSHSAKSEGKEKDKFDYFSSHPSTTERAQCPEEEVAKEESEPQPEAQSEAAVEAEYEQSAPVEAEPPIDTPLDE